MFYNNDRYIYIRRSRHTQGGTRQGIIFLTLVAAAAVVVVLQRHGVLPLGGDFFEVVWLLAAADNRICRKICRQMLFFSDFKRRVRHFFGVVLELARPLEACCFPPRRWFFRSCFTAAAAGNRICRKIFFSCQRHGVPLPGRWLLFYC